jgi:hypothetical protein
MFEIPTVFDFARENFSYILMDQLFIYQLFICSKLSSQDLAISCRRENHLGKVEFWEERLQILLFAKLFIELYVGFSMTFIEISKFYILVI